MIVILFHLKLNLGRFPLTGSVGRLYFYGNWFFLYPEFLWIEKKNEIMMVNKTKRPKIMSEQLIAGVSVEFFPADFVEVYNQTPEAARKFLLDGAKDVIEAARAAQKTAQETQLALRRQQEEAQQLATRQQWLIEAYQSPEFNIADLEGNDIALLRAVLSFEQRETLDIKIGNLMLRRQNYQLQNAVNSVGESLERLEDQGAQIKSEIQSLREDNLRLRAEEIYEGKKNKKGLWGKKFTEDEIFKALKKGRDIFSEEQ